LYRVDRHVNIDVFIKLQRVEDTGKHTQEICHYIKGMFEDDYDDWKFENEDEDDTVFNISPGLIQYEATMARNQIIQKLRFRMYLALGKRHQRLLLVLL